MRHDETRDNTTAIEATIIEADNRDETHWWTWPIPVADFAEKIYNTAN